MDNHKGRKKFKVFTLLIIALSNKKLQTQMLGMQMEMDSLKVKYSLPQLLNKLYLSKSSYYYQEKTLSQPDKYFPLRIRIKDLFIEYM